MGSYSCSVSPLDCTAGAGIASADEVCDDAGKVIKAELSVLLADAKEAAEASGSAAIMDIVAGSNDMASATAFRVRFTCRFVKVTIRRRLFETEFLSRLVKSVCKVSKIPLISPYIFFKTFSSAFCSGISTPSSPRCYADSQGDNSSAP